MDTQRKNERKGTGSLIHSGMHQPGTCGGRCFLKLVSSMLLDFTCLLTRTKSYADVLELRNNVLGVA